MTSNQKATVIDPEHVGLHCEVNFERTLKQRVKELLKPQNDLFPGAQPVSFRSSNMDLLFQEDYYVCEKSDGVRYLLLSIHTKEGPSCFLINRSNVYQYVNSVMLPCRENLNTFQHESLIDGELVIDENKSNGQKAARFLAFDLMVYNTNVITQRSFATRLGLLQQEIINPLQLFLSSNPDIMRKQPFRIELKKMERSYGLNLVLSSIPNLKHPSDGLIFTPVELPYKSGICSKLLKWKPLEKLTIDFRIQVTYNNDRKPVYHLQTINNGALKTFSFLQLSPEQYSRWKLTPPDGRIAEFKWDPEWKVIIIEKGYAPQTEIGGWVFVKFRPDKIVPNDEQVVKETLECIKNGVSREILERSIEKIRSQWKERERRATNQSLMYSNQNTLYDKGTILTKAVTKSQGPKNNDVINSASIEENDIDEEPVTNILDSIKKSPSPFDEDLENITVNNDDSTQENTNQDFSIIDKALLEYKNKLDIRNNEKEIAKEEVTSQNTEASLEDPITSMPLKDNQEQDALIDQLKQNNSNKNEIDLPFKDHGKRSAPFPEIKDSINATCSKRRLLLEANLDIVPNVPKSEELESTNQNDKKTYEPLKNVDLPSINKFTKDIKEELTTPSHENTFNETKDTSETAKNNAISGFHYSEVKLQDKQEKVDQIGVIGTNAPEIAKANIEQTHTKFEINTAQKNNIESVESPKKLDINSGNINDASNSINVSNVGLIEHNKLELFAKIQEGYDNVGNKLNNVENFSEKTENESNQTIPTSVVDKVDIINESKRPNYSMLKGTDDIQTEENDIKAAHNYISNSQNVNRKEFVQPKSFKISNTSSNIFKLVSIDETSDPHKGVEKNKHVPPASLTSDKGIDYSEVRDQDNIIQSSKVSEQPYSLQVIEPTERKPSYKPVHLSSMLNQPNKDNLDTTIQHPTNQSHTTVLPHTSFGSQITLNPPSNLIGSLNYGNKTLIPNVVTSNNIEYTHTTHVEIRPRPPEVPINKDFMQNMRKPSNPGVQTINRQTYQMPLIPPRALEPQLDDQPHQIFHTQPERPNYQKRGSQVAMVYPNIPSGMQPNPNITHYAQQVIIPEGNNRRGSVAVRIYPIQRPVISTNMPVDLNTQQGMIAAKQMQIQMLRRASHSQGVWIPNPNNPRQPNQHPFISQATNIAINRPQSPFGTKSHIASPNPNFSEPVFQVQHQPQFRSPHLPEYHHQQNYTRHQEYRQTSLQQIPQSPNGDIRNQLPQVAPPNVPTENTPESKPSSAPRQSKGMLDFIMNP